MKKDNVNHPPHYTKDEIECIDAIRSATGEGYEYYLQGNIIKYIFSFFVHSFKTFSKNCS